VKGLFVSFVSGTLIALTAILIVNQLAKDLPESDKSGDDESDFG